MPLAVSLCQCHVWALQWSTLISVIASCAWPVSVMCVRYVDVLAVTGGSAAPAGWGISVWRRRRKAGPELPTHVLGGFLLSPQPTLINTRSHQCEEKRKWLLLSKHPTRSNIMDWGTNSRYSSIPYSVQRTSPSICIHYGLFVKINKKNGRSMIFLFKKFFNL